MEVGVGRRPPAVLQGERYGLNNDERVKCTFSVSNPLNEHTCDATVLLDDDGRAMSELTLPVRKAIQLGLEPQQKGMKKSSNDADRTMTCIPQVFVEGQFIGEGVAEIVGAWLTAQVHEREYMDYIRAQPNKPADEKTTSISTSSTPSIPSTTNKRRKDDSPPPSPKDSATKKPLRVKLSPVRLDKRDDRVVIGASGQKKLGIKVSVPDGWAEIEALELEEEN